MTFTQIANEVATNTAYRGRVEYALFVAAVAVLAESNGTASHAARVVYAAKVLAGHADIRAAVLATFTNATFAATANADAISDGDFAYVMGTLFNALAGIGT